jgi:hypothetical protein
VPSVALRTGVEGILAAWRAACQPPSLISAPGELIVGLANMARPGAVAAQPEHAGDTA